MDLISKVDKFMSYGDLNPEATEALVEHLSYASKDEVKKMLDYVIRKYSIEFPFWLLLLSYRLAILQDESDPEFLQVAANNIATYGGPDFDHIANKYQKRAKEIKDESK